MIPTNDLHNFARYEIIITTRQSDGAKLTATRIVTDILLPVCWDVDVKYPQQSAFTAPIRENKNLPSTSQLINKAAEQGFGDWYPLVEKLVEIFPLDAEVGDQSKKQLTPKYVEPDTTDYLVD